MKIETLLEKILTGRKVKFLSTTVEGGKFDGNRVMCVHDLENNKMFYENHQGWINNLFHATNDLFLKSNRQEGSITYSYFIELLIRYEN